MSRLGTLLRDLNKIDGTIPTGIKSTDLEKARRVLEIADFWIDPMAVGAGGDVFGLAQQDIAFLVAVIDEITAEPSTPASPVVQESTERSPQQP